MHGLVMELLFYVEAIGKLRNWNFKVPWNAYGEKSK